MNLIHCLVAVAFLCPFLEAYSAASDSKKLDVANVESKQFHQRLNQSLLWAPYRSNCYFGIRPRYIDATPWSSGLFWFQSASSAPVRNAAQFQKHFLKNIRHFVEQGDNLERYNWELYDPILGGKQVLIDSKNNINLTILWSKSSDGNNWGYKVIGQPIAEPHKNPTSLSMIMYMSQASKEPTDYLMMAPSKFADTQDRANKMSFVGSSSELKDYEIEIYDVRGKYHESLSDADAFPQIDTSKPVHFSMTVPEEDTWKAKDIFQLLVSDSVSNIMQNLQKTPKNIDMAAMQTIRNVHDFEKGNFHFVQKTFDLSEPFEFDVIYNSEHSSEKISGSEELTELIASNLALIKSKYERKIVAAGNGELGFSQEEKDFAQHTFFNLVGGLGYFHGSQRVDRDTELLDHSFQDIKWENVQMEGPYSLFSLVPSRAFFPRGFYWDEGFHLLQLLEYDFDLCFEILQSWFNQIDEKTGWIPRELILGDEARSKVPEEFQVQSPQVANPPTLLLVFSKILKQAVDAASKRGNSTSAETNFDTEHLKKDASLLLEYSKNIYPKLLKHYQWFKETQKGCADEYFAFFEEEGYDMNAVNLHELYRWAGRSLDHCLPSGLDDYPRADYVDISEMNVDALAWVGVLSRSLKQLAEILGYQDDVAEFSKHEQEVINNLHNFHWSSTHKAFCDVAINPYTDEMEHICHEGYISLLPFALKLLPKNSSTLPYLVELMSDKSKIFSPYGLLSLSKKDKYYGTNENYWRSPVWLNINYLCLDALNYYFGSGAESLSAQEGETKYDGEMLEEIKKKMVDNVVPNGPLGFAKSLGNQIAGKREDFFESEEASARCHLEKARVLYKDLRKNLVKNVFKVWKKSGYVYENYKAEDGAGGGVEHFTGWTSLIVNIMYRLPAEL